MVNENFVRELETIVGKSNVPVTSTGFELYSYDASLVKGNPGVVVFPANTREVSQTVRAANKGCKHHRGRFSGDLLSGLYDSAIPRCQEKWTENKGLSHF